MQLYPIGVIHTPYKKRSQAPRQGRLSDNEIVLEILPPFIPALKGIERCSHLIVLYWGDQAEREALLSHTPFGEELVGVFSSRSPHRPNPIAFCVVDFVRREKDRIIVRGVDALDGSVLLDIKAYVPVLDAIPNAENAHIPSSLKEIALGRMTNA